MVPVYTSKYDYSTTRWKVINFATCSYKHKVHSWVIACGSDADYTNRMVVRHADLAMQDCKFSILSSLLSFSVLTDDKFVNSENTNENLQTDLYNKLFYGLATALLLFHYTFWISRNYNI